MKCKSIMWIILLSLCLIGTSTVEANENTNISIEVPENSKVGEIITAKVMLSNVEEAAVGLKLDVTYDANSLEFISDKAGEKAIGTMNLSKHVPEEQRIRVGIVALLGLKESGCYYEIQFKVKDTASATTKIDAKVSELTDSKGNELSYSTKGASMHIEGGSSNGVNTEEKVEAQEEATNDGENNEIVSQENYTNSAKIQISLQDKQERNIKEYFDGQENLSWNVEDMQVAELKEDGTIVPKQEGNTNIILKDEQGNIVEEVPLEVLKEENQAQQKKNINTPIMIIIVILGVIIGTVLGYKMAKHKVRSNKNL